MSIKSRKARRRRRCTLRQTARVASAWWATAITGRIRGTSGDGLADAMLLLSGAKGAPPTRDVGPFEKALYEAVLAGLKAHGEIHLSTDYGPEGALRRVASEIQVGGAWPTKTTMCVELGDVTVRAGYHARTTRLLGEPVWIVRSYRPPGDDNDLQTFARIYGGRDEAAARAAFETAAAALPEGGIRDEANWDGGRAAVLLYKDGDNVSP